MPSLKSVTAKLDDIEAEMKRIGRWQEQPLGPSQYEFTKPFAMDTMAFDQWLQFVFIPRVRHILKAREPFPSKSEVHGQAYREWKMHGDEPDVDRLLQLLKEFDAMFGKEK